jgi:hypothetical protein
VQRSPFDYARKNPDLPINPATGKAPLPKDIAPAKYVDNETRKEQAAKQERRAGNEGPQSALNADFFAGRKALLRKGRLGRHLDLRELRRGEKQPVAHGAMFVGPGLGSKPRG